MRTSAMVSIGVAPALYPNFYGLFYFRTTLPADAGRHDSALSLPQLGCLQSCFVRIFRTPGYLTVDAPALSCFTSPLFSEGAPRLRLTSAPTGLSRGRAPHLVHTHGTSAILSIDRGIMQESTRALCFTSDRTRQRGMRGCHELLALPHLHGCGELSTSVEFSSSPHRVYGACQAQHHLN
ncbi:hypothetical protein B0H17DRAFT_172576 [Mycena rosella]|uniref:Uncharacterized protein n=1 Tax=Mycena rosella TaxID=1033263 RepID=A0AAD7G6U3_MYCRO|nr:hypothetical protein B0H17DRAFT_172576 [Mycena rosella]